MTNLLMRYLRPGRQFDGPIPEPRGPWRLSPRYDRQEQTGMASWIGDYDVDRATRVRIPEDFGRVGSSARVPNRKEVFDDLWAKLGRPGQEPDVLVMVVGGASRFGHAAVAFKKDKNSPLEVCDIVKPAAFDDAKLVNFVNLPDYFFGGEGKPSGTEQGEAYWRSTDIIALWDVDEAKLQKLHDYARRLNVQDELGYAHFDMATGSLRTWMGKVSRRDENSYRNCSGFMSEMLKHAGIVEEGSIFPKQLAMRALQRAAMDDPDNVDVVKIPWVWSAVSAEKYPDVHPQRTPLHHNEDFDLGDLARARIVVEKDGTRAVVQTRAKPNLDA